MTAHSLPGLCFVLFMLFLTGQNAAANQPGDAMAVVTVNGTTITKADITSAMRVRDIPENLQPTLRKVFAERLIDERLMQAFLTDRKVTVSKEQLDAAVERAYAGIRRAGKKPEDVLKARGIDEAAYRRQLSLPLAWNLYARQIITNREIRQRFQQRRPEFDGTKLRASQIVLTLPKDADESSRKKAIATLEQIRSDITAGKITFAEAAKKHSKSPSGKNGGDIGVFAFRGTMPTAITKVAFSLKDKEVSKPFVSPFGVHILQVTERKPGQLSLEDVRPEIFSQLAKEHWNEIVAGLRKSARIEWKTKL